ncbi:MAG: hypothetical protein E3J72_18010 [Planctomycetota bacterium]|nr:MAG: hypothetical protein E3J72_18010 [Planctomycetota bacterium]
MGKVKRPIIFSFFRKHMKTFLWPIALILIFSFGITFTMGQVIENWFNAAFEIFGDTLTGEAYQSIRSELILMQRVRGYVPDVSEEEVWAYYCERYEMDRLGVALPEYEFAMSMRRNYAVYRLRQWIRERARGNEQMAEQMWRQFQNLPPDQQQQQLGRFQYDEADYFRILSLSGIRVSDHLTGSRMMMRLEKFQNLIAGSAKATTADLYKMYQDQFHRRKVEIACFSSNDFKSSITPEEKDLQAFYDDNREKYFAEKERIDVQYVFGRPADFEERLLHLQGEPTEEELKKYYEDHKRTDYIDYEAQDERDKRLKEEKKRKKEREDAERIKKAEEELKKLEEEAKKKDAEKTGKEPAKTEEKPGEDGTKKDEGKIPEAPPVEKKPDAAPEKEKPSEGKTPEPAKPEKPSSEGGGAAPGAFEQDMSFSILEEAPSGPPQGDTPVEKPKDGEQEKPEKTEPPAPDLKKDEKKQPAAKLPGPDKADKEKPAEEKKAGGESTMPAKKLAPPRRPKPPGRIYRKLEDVKADVRRKLMRDRTREALDNAFSDFSAALAAEVDRAALEGRGESGVEFVTVKQLAGHCGLTAVHTGLIDEFRAGSLEDIGRQTAVTDLFVKGRIGVFSGITDIGRGQKMIVRLLQRRRAMTPKLDEENVRKNARRIYIVEKAAEAAKKAAEDFVALEKEKGLDESIREKGVEVLTTDSLRRAAFGGKLEAISGIDSYYLLNHVFSVQNAGEWTGVLEMEQEPAPELEGDRLAAFLCEKRYYIVKCLQIEPAGPEGFAGEILRLQADHVSRNCRRYFYSLWRDDVKKRSNLKRLNWKHGDVRNYNEGRARERLGRIVDAQKDFFTQYKRYATLEELADPNRYEGVYLYPTDLGERDGYGIKLTVKYTGYNATAEPVKPGLEGTGNRIFKVDESGEIETGEPLEKESESET